jgi:homoserine/homoserine lactone efflux protein
MQVGLSLPTYLYFFVFAAAMTFSPGPMTMFLLSLGLKDGLRKTIPAQLGASTAYLISIVIFAIGLSRLVRDHFIVMQLIQIVGVGYILHLAYRQWISEGLRFDHDSFDAVSGERSAALYIKGMLTGFSNPKTIIMFSTVFPQFAEKPASRIVDLIVLGSTFLFLQFASGCSYGYFGQRIRMALKNRTRQKLLQRGTALLLVGVAVMLIRPIK